MNTNEFNGSTVEEAISNGLEKLGLTEEAADIDVIQTGGFQTDAIVRITPKYVIDKSDSEEKVDSDIPEELLDKSNQFVKGLLEHLNVDLDIKTENTKDGILHSLTGPGSSAVIGYRGEVLDAIQYLTLLVTNKDSEDFIRVSVDAGSYRQKRKETLNHLANRLAQKAVMNSRRVKIEPMNPYERRIIHFALQDNPLVTTVSEGEGNQRHVVILPNEEKSYISYGSSSFNRTGMGKTRKFGYTKRR